MSAQRTPRRRVRTALLRGGKRATIHLARAGLETLRAVEVVLEELLDLRSARRRGDRPTHIEIR